MSTKLKHAVATFLVAACFPVVAQDVMPVISYGFEGDMADDSGQYSAVLHNDAMVVATADGNHVFSTGSKDGYLDLGRDVGIAVLSKFYFDRHLYGCR